MLGVCRTTSRLKTKVKHTQKNVEWNPFDYINGHDGASRYGYQWGHHTHNLLSRQHDQQNRGKEKTWMLVITIRRCSPVRKWNQQKKKMKRKMNVSCLCVCVRYYLCIICKAKHLLLFFDYINCVRLLCTNTHTCMIHHHISLVMTSYLSTCDSFHFCVFFGCVRRHFACVVMFAWLVTRLHKILQTLWFNIRKKLWFMSLKTRVFKINWHVI